MLKIPSLARSQVYKTTGVSFCSGAATMILHSTMSRAFCFSQQQDSKSHKNAMGSVLDKVLANAKVTRGADTTNRLRGNTRGGQENHPASFLLHLQG